MKTIDDVEMSSIFGGGDSFYKDLGQFIGGFVSGVFNLPHPSGPLAGGIVGGIIAASL